MLDHLNIQKVSSLPSPAKLLSALPLTSIQKQFIRDKRNQIIHILNGDDPRLLVIVGPCSIHDITAAKEYATKLLHLSRQIEESCCVIMRVYFEKPRTVGGWKGFLSDPLLNDTNEIALGLTQSRQLLLDLADLGVPTATEFLDPSSAYYLSDLISWGSIGARTASSQIHRQLASALPMPVAFKNNPDGNIEVAINGVLSAATAHSFIGMNAEGYISTIHSQGNPNGHIVLRGGHTGINYDPESIEQATYLLKKAKLPSRLLIDCSHGNSFRQHQEQTAVFASVLKQRLAGNQAIRGILLESHLFAGNQPFLADSTQLKYAVSLTDPCLDWATTERLLRWGDQCLKGNSHHHADTDLHSSFTPDRMSLTAYHGANRVSQQV